MTLGIVAVPSLGEIHPEASHVVIFKSQNYHFCMAPNVVS